MEEIEVTGIVLNARDYKEKDKLIRVFTVELGNVSAILKGVNSPKAKLKFAGQPFCFAKFILIKSGDIYIVKTAELIDTFFDIALDYDSYMFGNAMLELCNYILKPNVVSESLFLSLLKTLQNIVYNEIHSKLSLVKFLIDFLDIVGYMLNFDTCDNCGMKFVGNIKFDYYSGTFRCVGCSGGTIISNQDFSNLRIIANTDISRLHTLKIKSDTLDNCINLLKNNIENRINFKIKSIM